MENFHHKVSRGLSQLNKAHKNRSGAGGKVEVSDNNDSTNRVNHVLRNFSLKTSWELDLLANALIF